MRKNNLFIYVAIILGLLIITVIAAIISSNANTNADKDATDAINTKDSQEVYNVLLLGKDSTADLCDTIILSSINAQSGDVSIMQIPRDTYFNFTDKDYKKINAAPRDMTLDEFSKSLGESLGINIDFYVSLDLDTVSKMVDLLSGIEINVPFDMDYEDPTQGLSIHLKKGDNTLNGESALQFLRYRSGYATGDLGRIDAQKLFLAAFVERLGELKNPTVFYKLFKVFSNGAVTNVNEQDVTSISLKLSKARDGKMFYVTAPGEAIQSEKSGAWYYILSKSATSEILVAHFGLDKEQNFDKNNKFVDNRNKSFYDIYNKNCEYKIYTADEINNNMIDIN